MNIKHMRHYLSMLWKLCLYYIGRFTVLCKIFTYLNFQQKFFSPMCTFISPVELAVMEFIFRFIVVGIAESHHSQFHWDAKVDNGAHGSEKLLLNIQVSEDFA